MTTDTILHGLARIDREGLGWHVACTCGWQDHHVRAVDALDALDIHAGARVSGVPR